MTVFGNNDLCDLPTVAGLLTRSAISTAGTIGCGGSAGQHNAAAEAESQKLNSDPSYEEQMMGGGEAAEKK